MVKSFAISQKAVEKRAFGLLASLLTLAKMPKEKRWDHCFSSIDSIYIDLLLLMAASFFAETRKGVYLLGHCQKCQKAKRSQGVLR